MKNLTKLYEHLQSAYDEAFEEEAYFLASEIDRIKSLIEEIREGNQSSISCRTIDSENSDCTTKKVEATNT